MKTLRTDHILVEPMLGYRAIKDLVVDLEPFFAAYRQVLPYLITGDPPPARERLQSPVRERATTAGIVSLIARRTTDCSG